MDMIAALDSFAALSQETRLKAFQILVRHEPDGLPAGQLAQQLAVPHNTLSAHLGVLARAGWVLAERQGRSIIYRAHMAHMKQVIRFLVRDCCGGHPQACEPLLAGLADT